MNISDPESNTFAIIDGIPVDIESCKIDREIKQGGSESTYRLVIRDNSWLHKHFIPREIILFICRNIFVIFPFRDSIEKSTVGTDGINKCMIYIPTSWSTRVESIEELSTQLNGYNQKL